MGVIHVVQLKFKPEVNNEKIDEIVSSLKALKDNCVLPGTQKTYITSLRAAADCSNEGYQNGFTHMVVTEFDSVADRDYYSTKDPVHLALASGLPPFVVGLQVLDIEV